MSFGYAYIHRESARAKCPGCCGFTAAATPWAYPSRITASCARLSAQQAASWSCRTTKSLYAPFPAALEDCYLALLWLKENGEKYGMRRDKIFVGGNSAGGGMTAALTLYARDRGEVNIAFQMPLYPMLDDRPTETSKNNDAPVWNTKSNIAAWELYLGGDYGTDRVSKYAAPARETDFSGLPPTLTFIGSIDPFLAETKSYVEALRAAGVPVEFRIFEGGFHSFDIYYFANIAKEANKFIRDGFKFAAENYCAPQPEDI